MRTTLTILVLTVLCFGFGVIRPSAAYGCSCAQVQVADAIGPTTPAAFVGRAVSVEEVPDDGQLPNGEWQAPRQWTFQVETVLAGDLPEVLVVGSGRNDGDCGYDFSNAGRIGVVAYGEPGNLTTGICGGIWDADSLIAAHGPGTQPLAANPPVESEADGIPLWPLAFVGVALSIAAIAILWQRLDPEQHSEPT